MKHEPKRVPLPQPFDCTASASNLTVTWFKTVPCDCAICRVRAAGRRAVHQFGAALERLAR